MRVTQQLLQQLEAGPEKEDSAAGAACQAGTGANSSPEAERLPVTARGQAPMQDRQEGHSAEQAPADADDSAEEDSLQFSAECSRPGTSTTESSSAIATHTSDLSTLQIARTAYATAAAEAAQAAADTGIPSGSKGRGGVLTFSQFFQVMVQLSWCCFPRIANGSRAWKLLLERHVQPLADKKRSRYAWVITHCVIYMRMYKQTTTVSSSCSPPCKACACYTKALNRRACPQHVHTQLTAQPGKCALKAASACLSTFVPLHASMSVNMFFTVCCCAVQV